MQVAFVFVPPGGGETDFVVRSNLEAIPQRGDSGLLRGHDPEGGGLGAFIVRRTWWTLDQAGDSAAASAVVECEFARTAHDAEMTPDHRASCEMYARRGKVPRTLETSVH